MAVSPHAAPALRARRDRIDNFIGRAVTALGINSTSPSAPCRTLLRTLNEDSSCCIELVHAARAVRAALTFEHLKRMRWSGRGRGRGRGARLHKTTKFNGELVIASLFDGPDATLRCSLYQVWATLRDQKAARARAREL